MPRDPVFIVAQYKCGTSWLLRALCAHPDVLGIGEIDVVKAAYDHGGLTPLPSSVEQRLEHFFSRSSWCPQDVRERLEQGEELPRHRQNFDRPQSIWDLDHKTLDELYRQIAQAEHPTEAMDAFIQAVWTEEAEASHLVMKAAAQIHVFDTLDEWRPGSRKLAITRDGRDAAISASRYREFSKARPWFGGVVDYEEFLARWARGALAVADRARHSELFLIRYEDLTGDFATTMRHVLRYLDLDASNEVIARIAEESSFEAVTGRPRGTVAKSALRRGIVGEWKEVLSEQEAEQAWDLIGDTLLHLGYEHDGTTSPLWDAIHTRTRPGGMPVHDNPGVGRNALLRQREALIARGEAVTRQRDSLAARRDALLRQRDALVRQRARLTEQRDNLVQNAREMERQRDVAVSQRDELAAHRDELLTERDIAITQRDEIAAHRDELLTERDIAITQHDEIAAHRDELLTERDIAITQRDEIAAHRDHLVNDREILRARVDDLRKQVNSGLRHRLRSFLKRRRST